MRVSRGEVLARRGALCHATSLHLSKWFLHHLPEPIRLLKASSKSYHAPAIQLLPLCQIGSIRVIEHQRTSAFPVLLHPSQANAFTARRPVCVASYLPFSLPHSNSCH